ncbi:cytochrome P450 [Amycolatopsis sp. NPDC005003]
MGEPVVRGRYFDGETELWLVTGYDQIVAVLTDPRFSNDLSAQDRIPVPGATLPEDLRTALTSTLAAYDPPDHTRLRRLVSHAFTVRRVQALRPRIAEIVAALLAELPERAGADGVVDLMEHFAHQLPILVIGELLGIPPGDQNRWRSSAEGLSSGDPARITTEARQLIAYMADAIAERRAGRHPADDLLTALVRVTDGGDRLTEAELVSLALSLLLAGHRTTASLIRTMAVLVLSGAVRCPDPGGIPAAVEEILRRHGPAEIGALRLAREPVDLGGARIAAGDLVLPVLASGNRDPRRFATPGSVDPARRDLAHLAFGHGVHYCVGAALARAMAEQVLAGLESVSEEMTLTEGVALTVTDPRSAALPVRLRRRTDQPPMTEGARP